MIKNIRTTIWLPSDIHAQIKIVACLKERSMSGLIKDLIKEEIKEFKENFNKGVK